ncbi:hypothetical protein [Rhodoglobus aureus]|uniref:Uncharacterized protein n=1 Tax=Rhodoglobus aureus TaxID=191497 RepID=A0ABP4G7Y2_9MICO
MKVQVWRSGGLLGRRVEWDVIVDEQPDPEQWYILIAELPWDEHPATMTMPDRYIYEIHCEPHEAVIPEQELVGPWRELVNRVRDAQKQPNATERPDAAEPNDTTEKSDPAEPPHTEPAPKETTNESDCAH